VTALGQRLAVRTTGFERHLGWIALAALIVRLAYLLGDQIGDPGVGDALYYSRQADRMAGGGGFFDDPANPGHPAADHPPLTALLLTPGSFFPGVGLPYHRFTMVALGVLTVVVIGYLGRRVGGDRVGLVAAGLAAIYPNLWINDTLAMSETPAALAVAVILITIYRFIDEPTVRSAVWVGVACGVGILARAELALFLPIVVVPVAWWARQLPVAARIGRMAIAGGVAVAILVPWTLFNLVRFEEPVLISTNDGLTIIGANCEDVYHEPALGLWSLQCAQRIPVSGDQSEISRIYRAEGVRFIRANRDRIPIVVVTRVARVWSAYDPAGMTWYNQGEGRSSWASNLGVASFYVLAPTAIAGAVILRRRRTPMWPLAATAVIVTITAAAFYGLVRFRIPAEVAIVVLAAVTIDALWRHFRRPATDTS
jgi:4-amino-4-deoxy-L-arabinose transferase-like glycosyltransferase